MDRVEFLNKNAQKNNFFRSLVRQLATKGSLSEKQWACVEKEMQGGRVGWVSTGYNGREYYQNYRGRCEDAPCCGCCNC